jgi:hypothetical protein
MLAFSPSAALVLFRFIVQRYSRGLLEIAAAPDNENPAHNADEDDQEKHGPDGVD